MPLFTAAVRPPALHTLILMTVASLMALNMILPSLPGMAAHFDITYGQASLTISAFMLVTAVLQLVIGPLSDIYGRRPVILWALAIFVLGSVGCVLAEDFATLMVFRIVQAAVIATNVVPRAMVRDTSTPHEATRRLATIGMLLAIGPMLAPMLGGALDQIFGWRANFHAFLVIGIGVFWLAWIDAGETNTTRGGGFRAHFRGYPQLFRDPVFWSYTMCLSLSVGTYFAFLTGTPLIATESFGLSGAMMGLSLGAPPVGYVVGNWLSQRLSGRMPIARLMFLGRLATLAGMAAALAVWLAGMQNAVAFFLFMPLIGVGNGLSIPPGSVGVMSVRPELAGSAAGISGALMIGTGALMATVTGLLLTASHDPLRLLLLLVGMASLAVLAIRPALRASMVEPPDTPLTP